ncbi:hypothetical protein [Nitratifractor sp.]
MEMDKVSTIRRIGRFCDCPFESPLDHDALRLILRKRLTKKEFRIFFSDLDDPQAQARLRHTLRLDEERYRTLLERIAQKLRKPRILAELRGETAE